MCNVMQRLDPDVFRPLYAHASKVIHLDIKNLLSLYIKIHANSLELLNDAIPPQCHTQLSGRLSDFILASKPQQATLIREGFTLKGDLGCAKAFDECIKQMDLDWEGFFAEKVGDNIALACSTLLKKAGGYLQDMLKTRSTDLVYYAQDEIHFLPIQEEAQAFYHAVDQLKMDVERFEAKLKSILC